MQGIKYKPLFTFKRKQPEFCYIYQNIFGLQVTY
jgi:hypothetical protein